MGGHSYSYFVPYQTDHQVALDALREREFRAGRYSPVLRFIEFSEPGFFAQNPGAQHASIHGAVKAAGEDGTRSILDISTVADEPGYSVAAPLDDDEMDDFFGTAQPSRDDVEKSDAFFGAIDRGQCRYVVLYKNGQPNELFFAGYSFD